MWIITDHRVHWTQIEIFHFLEEKNMEIPAFFKWIQIQFKRQFQQPRNNKEYPILNNWILFLFFSHLTCKQKSQLWFGRCERKNERTSCGNLMNFIIVKYLPLFWQSQIYCNLSLSRAIDNLCSGFFFFLSSTLCLCLCLCLSVCVFHSRW